MVMQRMKLRFKLVNENETNLLFFTSIVDYRENMMKLGKYFASN